MSSRWSGFATISRRTLLVAWMAMINIASLEAQPQARKIPSRERGETPTAKLLNKLEEQSVGHWSSRPNEWARTMKEIADLGPAAVPELIEELDAGDGEPMIRQLAFLLRAIGDRRAVPALIRAIPKTLCRTASDFGFDIKDQDILSFVQKYDLSEKNEGNRFSFSRPIREVTGALMLLTNRSFDERDLVFVHFEGPTRQHRLKAQLFHRAARRWADWWEQDWEKYTSDKAYSKVDLPTFDDRDVVAPEPPADSHFKTSFDARGLILEAVQLPKGRSVFYDIDTGRQCGQPTKWADGAATTDRLQEIVA